MPTVYVFATREGSVACEPVYEDACRTAVGSESSLIIISARDDHRPSPKAGECVHDLGSVEGSQNRCRAQLFQELLALRRDDVQDDRGDIVRAFLLVDEYGT